MARPIQFHLVHFKSKQLANELPFGRFWHLFSSLSGGLIIDQDHDDTFTAHLPSHCLGSDTPDPREIVYKFLGTMDPKDRVKIDEVLVHSQWTPNFSVAEKYHTDGLKVFLAGDAGKLVFLSFQFKHNHKVFRRAANMGFKESQANHEQHIAILHTEATA